VLELSIQGGIRKWEISREEAAVTADLEEALTQAQERCTRQLVQNAAMNAKCHSSQQKASQSFARIVI
jgi:hypothetical protein